MTGWDPNGWGASRPYDLGALCPVSGGLRPVASPLADNFLGLFMSSGWGPCVVAKYPLRVGELVDIGITSAYLIAALLRQPEVSTLNELADCVVDSSATEPVSSAIRFLPGWILPPLLESA